MKYKSRYIFAILALVILLCGIFIAYTQGFLPYKPIHEGELVTNDTFNDAVSLMKARQYDEAELIFSSLEHKVYLEDLGYLKLKKMQIALLKKDYITATNMLGEILASPDFSSNRKVRALENIYSSYRVAEEKDEFYNAIFSLPELKDLKKEKEWQSFYYYAEYAYKLSPSTFFGTSMVLTLLGSIDNLPVGVDKIKYIDETREFTQLVLSNSLLEEAHVSALPNQEILLINIYISRADMLARVRAKNRFPISTELDPYTEFEKAFNLARAYGDPLYTFYAAYTYIVYLVNNKMAVADAETKAQLGNPEIFSSENVSPDTYHSFAKENKVWTAEDREFIRNINTGLDSLIEKYTK